MTVSTGHVHDDPSPAEPAHLTTGQVLRHDAPPQRRKKVVATAAPVPVEPPGEPAAIATGHALRLPTA